MQVWKQALNAQALSYPVNPIDRLVAMADRALSSQTSRMTWEEEWRRHDPARIGKIEGQGKSF